MDKIIMFIPKIPLSIENISFLNWWRCWHSNGHDKRVRVAYQLERMSSWNQKTVILFNCNRLIVLVFHFHSRLAFLIDEIIND